MYNNSAADDESFNPANLILAYKIDVYAHQPLSRANYYIDAQTGKVLGKNDIINTSDAVGTANTYWSGTQTIHSDLNGGTYRLRDLTKGNGVITLHGESGLRGNDYTSTSSNWNLTGFDQEQWMHTLAFHQPILFIRKYFIEIVMMETNCIHQLCK